MFEPVGLNIALGPAGSNKPAYLLLLFFPFFRMLLAHEI